MERRHIAGHIRDSCPLRKVECEFCEGEVKATEMNLHLEDCDEFPLPCPNRCGREGEEGLREVKRKDIPVHLDEHCPLQKVQCVYWEHGCREEMERRQTDTHEREFFHIHFKLSMTDIKQKQTDSTEQLNAYANRIAILEKQNSDKDLQIASLTKALLSQLPTGRLEWNVKEVKQKIENKDITYSDPFYVGLYKCQCIIYWDFESTDNVGVFIRIMRGDFDEKLHWPIRYRRTLVLINRVNNKDNFVNSRELTNEDLEKYPNSFKRPTEHENNGLGTRSLISNTKLLEEKYYEQDSVALHISVEVLPSL
eukprot:TRINITY_DN807_c1_g1_i5.p1 TRINITY_DN807_c1_g1~~TRINITY_DN807_c1_g1_i5.p1  ORF type:complete len:309 (+),score=85.60 TRINITY_DN807_c1_g1_i5:473-1399(+)